MTDFGWMLFAGATAFAACCVSLRALKDASRTLRAVKELVDS